MPNRILRDWTDSETMDQLDVHTERFFTRLIMKVDDFGRYSSNIKLLKSNLFPLKSDIRETDIARWITECEKSGLIVTYKVALKTYLQINNFKQVLRQKVEKYPSPDMQTSNDKQTTSGCVADDVLNRNEVEDEKNVKTKGAAPPTHTPEQLKNFEVFQTWMNQSASNVVKMKEPITIDQYLELKKKFSSEAIGKLMVKMHNWKELNKKNVSAYLTFLNWSKKDFNESELHPPANNGSKLSETIKAIEHGINQN